MGAATQGAGARTVVSRRPRAAELQAEPNELLPTMRLPPVEARALRRKVAAEAGFPEPEDGGEVSRPNPLHAEVGAPRAKEHPLHAEVRAVVPTACVKPVQFEPPGAAAAVRPLPGRSRLHRPPLPMPDVLRAGPRPATQRPIASTAPTAAAAAPWPAVPESVTEIDTASLVLEVAESLTATARVTEADAAPPHATDPAYVASAASATALAADGASERTKVHLLTPHAGASGGDAAASPPDVRVAPPLAGHGEAHSMAAGHTAVQVAPPRATDLDADQNRPRSGGWVIGLGLAASVAAGVWWFAPRTTLDAGTTATASLAPLGAAVQPTVESTRRVDAPPVIEPLPDADAPDADLIAGDLISGDPVAGAPVAGAPVAGAPTDGAPLDAVPNVDAVVPPATAPPPAGAAALLAMLPTEATPLDVPASPTAAAHPPTPPVAAPTPTKARLKATKPKSGKSPTPTAVASAPPKPLAPAPKPTPALDATALLRDAEKAFADGRFGTALRNAQRSLADRHDPKAVRIVILSACKLRREDVARTQMSRLPYGQRRAVRSACKASGVDV